MTYEELITKINYHRSLYYDQSKSEISDYEYDQLYDQLIKVEKKQGWSHHDSPSILVGGKSGKIKHKIKLYSMKKVYEKEDINSSFSVITPKIDGTNLTVTYNNGKIITALTRGDGNFGDSVNHLVEYIIGLPKKIQHKEEIIITGECVTDTLDISNFRNYVSGALNLKNSEDFKSRNIRFIAHDLLNSTLNYTTRMKLLTNLDFSTVFDTKLCDKYPQDGIVYRINNYKECLKLGYTAKYPRFIVALKQRENITAETIIQKVEWAIGRTGTVNPVGIIEPVELDGATITKVTLHNLGFIEKHEIGLGDRVLIERAGGVIPKLVKVIEHAKHNNKITYIDAEKSINAKTKKEGPRLYVLDQGKHGTKKLLQHFIKTLEIKGLGPKSIDKINLTHPLELYQYNNWSILGINGEKIKREIEKTKIKPYSLVLAALGIEGVGINTAEKIVKILPTFDILHEIELYDIPSIGTKTKDKIIAWLITNEEWVKQLPLQLVQKDIDINNIVNEDKKICITGKLDISRAELSNILKNYGFKISNTVTKDCYALITGGETSSKSDKANKYNIKIIDYWNNRSDILNGQL